MSPNKKEEVVISNPRSSVEDDAIADLRNALNRLCIPEQQQESILKQLFIDPAAVAVDTTIAAAAAAAAADDDDAKNKQGGSKVTRVKLGSCGFEKSDQMDKEYQNDKDSQKFKADDDDADADAYGDDDDDDDDSGYDGNVQHPYVKSKIHYDSDEDSFVDYELSQQVNYN